MTERRSISKRVRFGVFKRDGFSCLYCGSHPPDVVLQIDHIVHVFEGGDNDICNLVTSCVACNSGKSSVQLTKTPETIKEVHALAEAREEQILAYQEFRRNVISRITTDIDAVDAAFEEHNPGYRMSDSMRRSVSKFLDHMLVDDVINELHLAYDLHGRSSYAFKYFCGICWRVIRGDLRWSI